MSTPARIDQIGAQLGSIFSTIMLRKKRFKPSDFSPYIKDPDEETATIEEAFQMLTSVAQPEADPDGD